MSRLSDGRRSIRGLSAVLTGLAASVRDGVSMASTPPPPPPTSRAESSKRLRRSTSRLDRGSASGRSVAVARGLGRGLLVALLSLPLLLVFAAGQAQAQTATLSITAPADANEGDSGTRDLEFTVTKSGGTADATGYQICFTGTATIHTPSALVFSAPYPAIPAASDYQAVWGIGSGNYTVWNQNCIESTVPANQTSPRANHIIGIRVKGDTDAESDETVIATLSLDGRNPGVTLGASVATHTIRDDDAVSVPIDWALKPADVEGGESFRLLFVTNAQRDAQSADIADYNAFVQARAKAGHSAITDDMGDQFKVLGSTATVDARDNTGTTGPGVPIYWLGGEKVADDYADFYDGSWDSSDGRFDNGNVAGNLAVWTGSNADGTKHTASLGNSVWVRLGNSGDVNRAISAASNTDPSTAYRLYALSPVFEVAKPTTVWIRGSVTVDVCELNGSEVPASVCESDDSSPERQQCEAAWTPAWAKPGAVAREQVSQADINAARASVAAICGHNASATYVQERHGRDEITVTEGGAAGEITVGLSKKLGAGETVTVPLTASGVANADYAIALRTGAGINTGVALNTSNPHSAARPAVAFTGHATDEVRFASLNVSGVSDSANEGSETLTLGIGTVTNTNLTAGTQLHPSFQTARVRIRDAGAGLQAEQAPTKAVANVQVTAVDDASASVTWDAVEHATSYGVSWSAESSDSLNASAGAETVTGTTATIRHDASVAMTLTVTVRPEYVDENGETQQLDALAGTETLEVGPKDGPIGSGGGTNGGGNGDGVQAGEGESPGTAAFALPVAHWRLDGDALDWAGSSHGTVGGGAAFEANGDSSGVGTHALVLDGVDDYVDLASHVSNFPLGDAARSVTGWFKAAVGNQRQTFLTYGPNVAGQRFSIAADRTQALVAVSGHAWGVNGLDLSDGWHHVAVTYAGGNSDGISIYLDGALQGASTLVGAPQPVDTRAGPAAIGRNASGAAHYAGSIDDVRLYGYALSAAQVQAIAARNGTASAQATATMPGGPLPALLALPRLNGGASSNGGAALANAPESGGPRSRTILSAGPGAPSPGGRTHVPLLPGSSNPLREGILRIVNPSARAGEVRITAVDDAGWRREPVILNIGAGETAQLRSRDLERGNPAMGLDGATGPGTGDWRLEVSSDLGVDVLPYVRTADGTLRGVRDVAPATDNVHRVALFNPADGLDAAGRLRLTNRGAQALRADITGIDDTGASPGGEVSVGIAAHESVLLTAAELEVGGAKLNGALGDGEGAWRLRVASDGDLAVMSLLETADGHLANLSAAATAVAARQVHVVAGFPSSSGASGERGVLRIVNASEGRGFIRIQPRGGDGWVHPPLTLALGAGEAANLDAWDLELGNAAKGLSGSAGPGAGGAWHLEISGDLDIEVLAYVRSPNGLLKPLLGNRAVREEAR